METRAPFVVVGAFVLAAIGAVFGFVYWLHNTGGLGPRATYHVQFDIDLNAQTYSTWVIAPAGSRQLLGSNVPLRTTVSALTTWVTTGFSP